MHAHAALCCRAMLGFIWPRVASPTPELSAEFTKLRELSEHPLVSHFPSKLRDVVIMLTCCRMSTATLVAVARSCFAMMTWEVNPWSIYLLAGA